MNASATTAGNAGQPYPADRDMTALFWGLQYCRASTLSLTRLELALESGDRQRIIEAMDRLHALDGEMERKIASLPAPAGQDPEREAINQHLGREKMAVAFEKLVLASGISGPGLASPTAPSVQRSALRASVPDIGWPGPDEDVPEPRLRAAARKYGPRVAVLLAVIGATVATIVAMM